MYFSKLTDNGCFRIYDMILFIVVLWCIRSAVFKGTRCWWCNFPKWREEFFGSSMVGTDADVWYADDTRFVSCKATERVERIFLERLSRASRLQFCSSHSARRGILPIDSHVSCCLESLPGTRDYAVTKKQRFTIQLKIPLTQSKITLETWETVAANRTWDHTGWLWMWLSIQPSIWRGSATCCQEARLN